MENKQMKCVKGKSCLYCGSNYCRFVDELDQLKIENEKLDTVNKRLVAELTNPVFDSFEELDKCKQTLAEIKEIVIKTGIDHKWDMRFQRWKTEILQKISECEVEDGWKRMFNSNF